MGVIGQWTGSCASREIVSSIKPPQIIWLAAPAQPGAQRNMLAANKVPAAQEAVAAVIAISPAGEPEKPSPRMRRPHRPIPM